MDQPPERSKQGYKLTSDTEREAREKKGKLLAALREEVEKELAKNPNFNISTPWLGEILRKNPEKFLFIRDSRSFVRQLGGEMNYIRQKLGLPESKVKRSSDF